MAQGREKPRALAGKKPKKNLPKGRFFYSADTLFIQQVLLHKG